MGLIMGLGDDPVLIVVRMQWSPSAIAATNGFNRMIVYSADMPLTDE
jgi:hypothetical protein